MDGPTRRDLLAALGLAASGAATSQTVAAASTGAATNAGTEWSAYQHDAGNTGYAPGADPPDAPDVVWTADVGSNRAAEPAAAGGTVYVPAGSDGLYAVDAAAGTERWRALADAPVSVETAPAVADGTVYVGGSEHTVLAVDARTGDRRWSLGHPVDVSSTSPTIAGGTAYIARDDGRVLALDASTGDERWVAEVPRGDVRRAVAVADGTVYHATDEGVAALDADTGDRRWFVDVSPWSAVVTDGDGVYFLAEGVVALEADTGERRWKVPVTGVSGAPPSVVGESVVARGAGHVTSIDAEDGSVEWTYREEQRNNDQSMTDWNLRLTSNVAVAGETGFVLSANGILSAFDVTTGAERATTDLDAKWPSTPAVAGRALYLVDGDGTLYALGNEELADVAGEEDQSAPTPTTSNPGRGDWLGDWTRLLAWLAGVPVVGALVLAGLVALTGRDESDDTADDGP